MTRVECMRSAAWCMNRAEIVAAWGSTLQARGLRVWADEWRARGKAIPRRVGMCCARARRRHRLRLAVKRVSP